MIKVARCNLNYFNILSYFYLVSMTIWSSVCLGSILVYKVCVWSSFSFNVRSYSYTSKLVFITLWTTHEGLKLLKYCDFHVWILSNPMIIIFLFIDVDSIYQVWKCNYRFSFFKEHCECSGGVTCLERRLSTIHAFIIW